MGLKLKIGKETIQGYTKVLSHANMTDCYSYGLSALIAVEFLRLNKARTTGIHMGLCILALKQVLFAKIKRDPHLTDRLPIGTILWGDHTTMDKEAINNENLTTAIGGLNKLLRIWADHLEK